MTAARLSDILLLLTRVEISCLGKEFGLKVSRDDKGGRRVYLQLIYTAPCTKGGDQEVKREQK